MKLSFSKGFLLCGLWALLIATFFSIDATETKKTEGNELIVKRDDIPELDLVILHLKNGMKVALKKTPSDEEIVIRLTAVGGFSSFPESQRASIQLASQIAMRSGVGSYQFDQLHALLYDHSIEFNAEVQAFSRFVEGTAFSNDIDTLLHLINLYFTKPQFTEHGFRKVLEKEKEKISYRNKRTSRNFAESYRNFNTPNLSAFNPLTETDMERADFATSKKYFLNSFNNPEEFVCVISGCFDTEKMISLITKHLATIPACKNHSIPFIPQLPKFSKGIKKQFIENPNNFGETMTVFTFPVEVDITNKNFINVETITGIIYRRLKYTLRDKYGMESMVILASTEYPLYPYLNSPLIKICYTTKHKFVKSMEETILAELKKLQNEEITQEEVVVMNRKCRKAQRLHEKDNCYWVMVLSNYLMWNWDPMHLPEDLKPLDKREKVQEGLRTYFSLDNFTMLSAQQ